MEGILHLLEEFPCSKAKSVGTHLGIKRKTLNEIQHNNPRDCKQEFEDVIDYWVENDPEKSWTKLADAVKMCGYALLADKIRKQK